MRNETRPVRRRTVTRALVPEITELPNRNFYLITTDNINESSSISDTYPLNQDKIWQIYVPQDCKMTVYFSQFDLEVSDRCNKDSFSVQTSKRQREIYRYCKTLHSFESRGKKRIQMTFHSDDSIPKGGIRATVCISNRVNTMSDNDFDSQLPCTCNTTSSSPRRRKKAQQGKILTIKHD